MKKPILHTLGFAVIAVFFFVFCGDDAPDGSEGGQVDALLSKFYNKETPNVPTVTTYTVTFNSNGGTGTVPAAKSVSANNSITLPEKGDLSKGELVFNGWNTKSDGTGTNHPAGTAYTVTGNITLYATWKEASTGGGDETGLVLAAGEAWVSGGLGYIFTSTRIIKIHNVLDSWWYVDTSIYQTFEDIITINSIQWTYSISGNDLDIDICSCILTKTSGVEPKAGFPSFTDTRDDNSYRLVRLGTQVWFSRNVNYNVAGSVCYDNSADSCAKYGRLYTWEAVNEACPAGWHLPSDNEWDTLVNFSGGSEKAGGKLKSKTGWNNNGGDNGNGTDDYGFSALPGGYYAYSDDADYIAIYGEEYKLFDGVGSYGSWWSATKNDAGNVWFRAIYNFGSVVGRFGDNTDKGTETRYFSVRCVQN